MSKYVYLTSKIDQTGSYIPTRTLVITPDTTQISLLNGIPTGYTENQRIGRKIELKRLHLDVDVDSGLLVNNPNIRFVVVYHKQPNGKPITESTFFYNHPDCAAKSTLLPFNEIARDDFVVLFDKFVSHYTPDAHFCVDIDLTGRLTYYSGDTEFQDHVQYGGLYTVMLASAPSATASAGSVQFAGTLFYNDK